MGICLTNECFITMTISSIYIYELKIMSLNELNVFFVLQATINYAYLLFVQYLFLQISSLLVKDISITILKCYSNKILWEKAMRYQFET